MREALVIGKLLPTHPDILPILLEIREKYKIPEISPGDDSIKILLKYELEIDWKAGKVGTGVSLCHTFWFPFKRRTLKILDTVIVL